MPTTKLKFKTKTVRQYTSSDIEVPLPAHDTDVTLVLPDGERIELQWRVESPTLDICMQKDRAVTCWKGIDMEPAPAVGPGYIRNSAQLVIPFDPENLNQTEFACDCCHAPVRRGDGVCPKCRTGRCKKCSDIVRSEA